MWLSFPRRVCVPQTWVLALVPPPWRGAPPNSLLDVPLYLRELQPDQGHRGTRSKTRCETAGGHATASAPTPTFPATLNEKACRPQMRRKRWIIYSTWSINHGVKPKCFSSPTALSLKGKRPGDGNNWVFGRCPPDSFAHFTEYPILTCFAPFRKPVSLNPFIFATNAVSTLQTARVRPPKGDLKPGKTPNFACALPLFRRNEIQLLCTAGRGLWAQPRLCLVLGAISCFSPEQTARRQAVRRGVSLGLPRNFTVFVQLVLN